MAVFGNNGHRAAVAEWCENGARTVHFVYESQPFAAWRQHESVRCRDSFTRALRMWTSLQYRAVISPAYVGNCGRRTATAYWCRIGGLGKLWKVSGDCDGKRRQLHNGVEIWRRNCFSWA